ncbi:MAG: signal peptidase I [bacterium]
MENNFWQWLMADPEDKTLKRELTEIGILYFLFVLIAYFFDDVPLRWTLFTTVALVALAWEGGREILRIGLMAAVIVFGLIRPFMVQAFYIPSRSMENTLLINDHIFVNKFVYNLSDPQRWDIAVFEYPNQPDKDYIKRLVGLPGDTIAVKNHQLYVNGRAVKRDFVRNEVEIQLYSEPKPISEDLPPEMIRFRGDGIRLNRRVVLSQGDSNKPVQLRASILRVVREADDHYIKEVIENGTAKQRKLSQSFGPIEVPKRGQVVDLFELNPVELKFYFNIIQRHTKSRVTIRDRIIHRNGEPLEKYTIPEDMFFFMGDNRDHSEDSRVWGFVPRRNLLGEAFFVYWPLNRIGIIGD